MGNINLNIAIDFSLERNKKFNDPNIKNSLHNQYGKNYEGNEYIDAIQKIGSILQEFDDDKKISAYGFGAEFKVGHQ